jgi:RHS repeat-associated protein
MHKSNLLLVERNNEVEIDLAYSSRTLGEKQYELTNHLGNVLAVISDKKLADNTPDVVSTSDYFPFGMAMPGRTFSGDGYRYGFGGHEKDDEVKGNGNYYATQARPYDPHLGRWWSVDPKFKLQPGWSSYKSFLNNPIVYEDSDGEVEFKTTMKINEQGDIIEMEVVTVNDKLFRSEQYNKSGLLGKNDFYSAVDWQDKNTISIVVVDTHKNETPIPTITLFTTRTSTGTWRLFNKEGWAKAKIFLDEKVFNNQSKYSHSGNGIVFTSESGQGQENKIVPLEQVDAIVNIDDLMQSLSGMKSVSPIRKALKKFKQFVEGVSAAADASVAMDLEKEKKTEAKAEATEVVNEPKLDTTFTEHQNGADSYIINNVTGDTVKKYERTPDFD